MATCLSKTAAIKVRARNEFRPINKEEAKEIEKARIPHTSKYLPNSLLKALQVAYGKKCTSCNQLCTFGHILRDHHIGKFTLSVIL